jgi:SNF2 family DNA or RNA helicase
MGLGKALTVISLIVSDLPHAAESRICQNHVQWTSSHHDCTRATLLVVPLSRVTPIDRVAEAPADSTVLQVWSNQIQQSGIADLVPWHWLICRSHVRPHFLRWQLYYGKNRIRIAMQLESLDLVITTYSIVAHEWRKGPNPAW